MKVTVSRCDRCGELEVENASTFTHVTISNAKIKPPRGIYNRRLFKSVEKDLCIVCATLLESFMKGDPPPNLVPALIPLS